MRFLKIVLALLVACSVTSPTETTVEDLTVPTPLASFTTQPAATTAPPSLADMWVFEPEQFDAPFAIPEPVGGMLAGGSFTFVLFNFDPIRPAWPTLVVTTSGPSSVQAWLDDLASAEGVTMTEPIETEVGGISALSVDVEISSENTADSCGFACLVLFGYTWGAERNQGGTARRLLLLDVYSETVAIIANSSYPTFDEWWGGDVENLLEDLVWLSP